MTKAVAGNKVNLVKWLIARGADVKVRDTTGKPVLGWAKSRQVAELLIKAGADPKPKTERVNIL